jgi:hypothetical protein
MRGYCDPMTRVEPVIRHGELSDAVIAAREEFAAVDERNGTVLRPAIEAHMTAYGAALDELTEAHRIVSDGTDLDVTGGSRSAAIWLMAGRCLGQARACLHLAEGGFAHELPALLRQLHESNQLLNALGAQSEDAVVDRWVGGKYVSARQALEAIDRHQRLLREQMIRAGIAPPGPTKKRLERRYGHMSEFVHNRRAHVLSTVSPERRLMPIGPHPDWSVRAAALGDVGIFLTETVTVAGFALSLLLGREWFVNRFNPTFQALLDLSRRVPIDSYAMKEARRSA